MISSYVSLLRPKHWLKNLFLFAAPFFGGKMFYPDALTFAVPVFMSFSLCASSAYIMNDIVDSENDNHHPKKRLRPVAAGEISKKTASAISITLAVSSFILSYSIAPVFFAFALAYFVLQAAYSVYLKNIAVVDIFCIAAGFVLRVLAGGAAFHVGVSKWLFLTMFMISLVLAVGKRTCELTLLAGDAEGHRKSLSSYSRQVLDEILIISSSAAVISYALYTVEQFKMLVYTVPVVTFGLFRYLIISKQGMGDPTEALTRDRWLAGTVVLWLILVGLIRY